MRITFGGSPRRFWALGGFAKGICATVFVMIVSVSAQSDETARSDVGYPDVAAAISTTMRANHYNPDELDTPEYRRIEEAVARLAAMAQSDDEFVKGFREIWRDGPFSHVQINVAQQSASELADHLDSLRIGGGGAILTWDGDVAILTVNTMMGLDTIEEIEAAYTEISETEASALVIDLRENTGGAFAVLPLVSHLLSEPLDAGSFVSRPWNETFDREPDRTDLEDVEPWVGWSIKSFWADVQAAPVTRIRFVPMGPVFDGPVYVLTSKWTASAAELAVDAIRSAKRAVIVGETTAGQMLSQKIFDIPGGFQLSLPIADYYSIENGRIEGVGIEPDIQTSAAAALDVALENR